MREDTKNVYTNKIQNTVTLFTLSKSLSGIEKYLGSYCIVSLPQLIFFSVILKGDEGGRGGKGREGKGRGEEGEHMDVEGWMTGDEKREGKRREGNEGGGKGGMSRVVRGKKG